MSTTTHQGAVGAEIKPEDAGPCAAWAAYNVARYGDPDPSYLWEEHLGEDQKAVWRQVYKAALSTPAPRTDGGMKAGDPDEITEGVIAGRARKLLADHGWEPGQNLHVHAVIGLMTKLGMGLLKDPPQDRCAHPACGCDADSVCGSVSATPAQPAGAVPDGLRAGLVEAIAQHFHDHDHPHEGYNWTWPEYADDDGRRGSGDYVRITPPAVQMECREAAERITRRFEQFLSSHPAGQSAGSGAETDLASLAEAASVPERAYGILWRLTAFDTGQIGYAHDARKLLLAAMDKKGQRRGIAWATRQYGPLGPNPRFMLSDEDRMEMGL